MSKLMTYVLSSMAMFFVLFAIVRISFAVFLRDVDFMTALTSLDTWGPVFIGTLLYGVFIYLFNRRKYQGQ